MALEVVTRTAGRSIYSYNRSALVPLGRLELPHLAPEASALSAELQGHALRFHHSKADTAEQGLRLSLSRQPRPQPLDGLAQFLLKTLEAIAAKGLPKGG